MLRIDLDNVMSHKKQSVNLKENEYADLQKITKSGHERARIINRARILLLADQRHQKIDTDIAEALGVSVTTVANVRKRYHAAGLESIQDRPRGNQPTKFKGKPAARITALACTQAPPGHARWTLRLLADKAIELGMVDSISHQSVRNILKKK